jgi:hypothetical protein
MQATIEQEKLFQELELWSQQKDAFSVDDFLKEKGVAFSDFDLIANSNSKFMEIWGIADDIAWENLTNALFTKSLSRSRIAEYIKQCEAFQDRDPEEVMQSMVKGQERFELYLTAIGDTESLKKYGRIGCKDNQIEALMKCSLERGMITQEVYDEMMSIKDEDDEDMNSQDLALLLLQ